MTLFDIEPDAAAFVETNLKTQEKIAIRGLYGLEKIGSIKKEEKQVILLKAQLKILALLNQTTIQLQKYYRSN